MLISTSKRLKQTSEVEETFFALQCCISFLYSNEHLYLLHDVSQFLKSENAFSANPHAQLKKAYKV